MKFMKIIQKNLLIINIVLLIFVFFIPNNSSYYFDGLPFTNKYETIFFTIFFPFFLFFYNFIKSRKIFILLIIISIFKIFLISAPTGGANVKQYFTYNDFEKDNYIKTFDTFWNKNISTKQYFPWKTKNNFPMDWTHLSKININNDSKEQRLRIDKFSDFENISMFYNFNFYLLIKTESKIDFLSNNGSKLIVGKTKIWDENLEKFIIIEKKLDSNEIIFGSGLYNIDLTLNYTEKNWKFDPKILGIESNVSLFESGIIFSRIKMNNKNELLFLPYYNKIGFIYDCLIIILLILIAYKIYNLYLKNNKLSIILSFFFISSYFIIDFLTYDIIFSKFKIIDGVGSFSFALTNIIIFTLFILIKLTKCKNINLHNTFILSSILCCLLVFANIFNYDLESFSWAGAGDDWTTFQEYSRQIVIDGEWLIAGEKVYYFRPGSRYIYALTHIIFGMSAFSYKMLNVWCIILCAFLLIKILIRLNCNLVLSFASGILLLSIYTGDNFRWLLLVGLSEYYAMLCMIISIYIVIGNHKINLYKFLFIILLGIIQVWLREEHLPLVLATIYLLSANLKKEKKNYNRNYIINFFLFTRRNFSIILLYSILIFLGFATIYIRNYYVGGSIGFFDIHAVKTLAKPEPLLSTYYDVFSRLILGVDQYYVTLPRLYSIINIFAIIIILLTILNYNKYKYIHFGLPILLIGIIFPYFFVENIAYTPRYAIHILPVSLLICSLYINKFFKVK